jgi:dynein heavy chain, axonemal
MDTKEACWLRVVQRCRANLHVVLAMSPVGETLQRRCRDFPGFVGNTVIDWFDPWPEVALESVAAAFLKVWASVIYSQMDPMLLLAGMVQR